MKLVYFKNEEEAVRLQKNLHCSIEEAIDKRIRTEIDEGLKGNFEQLLGREYKKRKWERESAEQHMHALGHSDFEMDSLFETIGIGSGRVLMHRPIIVPYNPEKVRYDDQANNEWDVNVNEPTPSEKRAGFHFKLGFFEKKDVKDRNGKIKSARQPVIFIDSEVMDILQNLATQETTREASVRVLYNMQRIFTTSMHDYIHHSMYPLTNPRRLRGAFYGADAPLHSSNSPMDDTKFMHKDAPIDGHPTDSYNVPSINEMTTLEAHAELFNRDIWRREFEKNPKSKKDVVAAATQFLKDVSVLKQAIEDTHGADTANEIAEYLVPTVMHRFFRIIDIDDPILKEDMTIPNGTSTSFVDANETVALRPFEMTGQKIWDWLKRSTLYNYKLNEWAEERLEEVLKDSNKDQLLPQIEAGYFQVGENQVPVDAFLRHAAQGFPKIVPLDSTEEKWNFLHFITRKEGAYKAIEDLDDATFVDTEIKKKAVKIAANIEEYLKLEDTIGQSVADETIKTGDGEDVRTLKQLRKDFSDISQSELILMQEDYTKISQGIGAPSQDGQKKIIAHDFDNLSESDVTWLRRYQTEKGLKKALVEDSIEHTKRFLRNEVVRPKIIDRFRDDERYEELGNFADSIYHQLASGGIRTVDDLRKKPLDPLTTSEPFSGMAGLVARSMIDEGMDRVSMLYDFNSGNDVKFPVGKIAAGIHDSVTELNKQDLPKEYEQALHSYRDYMGHGSGANVAV